MKKILHKVWRYGIFTLVGTPAAAVGYLLGIAEFAFKAGRNLGNAFYEEDSL